MQKFELDDLMLLELDVRSDDITDEDMYRLLSLLRYKAGYYDDKALDLEIELRPKDFIYWSPEQEREYCRSMVGCRGCPVYDWYSDDCLLTKQKPVKLRQMRYAHRGGTQSEQRTNSKDVRGCL